MSLLSFLPYKAGALACCLSFSMLGQITQGHAELCGNQTRTVPVPANVSATLNRSNGVAVLTLQINGSAHAVELPGVQQEIREVCPLSQNRLIAFAWFQT